MKIDEWSWLLLFLLFSFGAAALGSIFTARSVNTWYVKLRKPSINPPNWIFAPIWTTLYLLMALAAWLVWRSGGWRGGRTALSFFFLQLVLNVLWSAVFFGLRRPALAMVEILFLLVAIVATAMAFLPISVAAFWLMLPYVTWVSFASVLNFKLWQLNRGMA